MQLGYHGYYFVDLASGERYLADIGPFLSGFVRWKNMTFKNAFTHGGESVFLLPAAGSIYLFVQARDNEIIKRIERSTMSVTEIQDALGEDGSVGFASFILIETDYLAICSTALAPRMSAFSSYVNAMLARLEIGLSFETVAMTHTLQKADVQKLTHVGNFSMKVKAGNRLWHSIVGSFGGGDREDFDIGSVEVTIRPAKVRANNHRALKAAIESVGEDGGLESFDARAKVDLADRVTDVFIVGAGGIRDPIDSANEATILEQISRAAASNKILGDRLHEFRQDPSLSKVDQPADLGLAWPPARAVTLGSDEDAR